MNRLKSLKQITCRFINDGPSTIYHTYKKYSESTQLEDIFLQRTKVSKQLQEDIKNPFITVITKNKNSDSHSNTATAKSGETRRYFHSAPTRPGGGASLLTGNDCLILALL